jgi:chaperone required for assembly of F1-ATPase
LAEWFIKRFPDLSLSIQRDQAILCADEEMTVDLNDATDSFSRYLNNSYDFDSLIALNYMAESLKSVILAIALTERQIEGGVNEACYLSQLETIHQYEQWGKVEWHHDINESELKSRVSAALICCLLNNSKKSLSSSSSL